MSSWFTLKIWNFLAEIHKWIFGFCGCWQLISLAAFDEQRDKHRRWMTGYIVFEHSLCLWRERPPSAGRAAKLDCCDWKSCRSVGGRAVTLYAYLHPWGFLLTFRCEDFVLMPPSWWFFLLCCEIWVFLSKWIDIW